MSQGGPALFYLLDRGATTALLLQVDLEIPEATAYRVLKRFKQLKIIEPALKLAKNPGERGGPKSTIWAIIGASTEDVASACRRHYRALSPKYRVAEEVYQTALTRNGNAEEIHVMEFVLVARELKVPTRSRRDIVDMAATIATDNGLRVWR